MGGLLSSLVLSTGELEPSTKYFEGEMTPASTTYSCYSTPCSNRFSSFEYNNDAAASTGDLRTKSFGGLGRFLYLIIRGIQSHFGLKHQLFDPSM
ncbi:hypothetical protein PanWU01x14_033790 [Parasponia andersonii]|uniref:Uncharacterized protein n=1 Tax=Parasponia andersonii TaxID=3476 RepID=A0A2P5DTR9_PARAD|nr:hypothetical protein PanWU01x14_033790 [Parasponia andersonii]